MLKFPVRWASEQGGSPMFRDIEDAARDRNDEDDPPDWKATMMSVVEKIEYLNETL
jgi:hypothetical protein